MANFNNVPTGDNSANNGGYTPESFSDTDDTAQLPKFDEYADSFNGDNTTDVLPTTDQEQSSPENNNPEHESHFRRNLVISGVAVVALAACIGIFNGSGDSGGSTPDTDGESTITESYDNEQSYIDNEQTELTITQPEEIPQSSNGLSMADIKNDLGDITATPDSIEFAGDYISDWLYNNGYTNASVVAVNEADYILGGTGGFYIQANDRNSGMLEIRFNLTADGMVDIDIHDASFVERDNGYVYTSDSIPTADEAREIAMQNLQ